MLYDPRPHLSRCAAAWGKQLAPAAKDTAEVVPTPQTPSSEPPSSVTGRLEDAPTRQEGTSDDR